jgi:hypothetical protein
MRRGGITSASDRRVSSDEQPSRTHGGPEQHSAKPMRAKCRVLHGDCLRWAAPWLRGSNSIPSFCLWFDSTSPARCAAYPCAYPTSKANVGERRLTRPRVGFSIPPQATAYCAQVFLPSLFHASRLAVVLAAMGASLRWQAMDCDHYVGERHIAQGYNAPI